MSLPGTKCDRPLPSRPVNISAWTATAKQCPWIYCDNTPCIHLAFICLMSLVAAFVGFLNAILRTIPVLPAMEWLISTTEFKRRDRSCFDFHPSQPFKALAIKIECNENVCHACTSVEKVHLECSHTYLYRATWISTLKKSPQSPNMEPG